MLEFLGHLHPLLVHLPIGFFLLGAVMILYSKFFKYTFETKVFDFILFLSLIVSVFSSISGYIHAKSSEYQINILSYHQFSGLAFTACLLLFFIFKNRLRTYFSGIYLGLSIVLILVGHFGGSLTHGEDFLTIKNPKKEIENIEEALVYEDIIKPILEEKCYSCHSASKQKGELGLDKIEAILKGGKHGKILVNGNPENSLIIKRAILPISEEEHMPPKGKAQLTENEIKILTWWISQNTSFTAKVKEVKHEKALFASLGAKKGNILSSLPTDIGPDLEKDAIKKLVEIGVGVSPVHKESNYILINIFNYNLKDSDWLNIEKLKNNIVWFKSNKAIISTKGWSTIASMKELRTLGISGSNLSDNEIIKLSNFEHLESLNISNTQISIKGLKSFRNQKKLHSLFLFNSKIDNKNYKDLKLLFPLTKIDTGNYQVPTFETDTLMNTFK